ncbi:MAG: glycosyltransferase [Candidatus Latescibacteria bacterium]|nr:glycosyltransferase [Candidatus Latescibacterota bacterium]
MKRKVYKSFPISVHFMKIAYFVNYYPVDNQPVFEDEALAFLRLGHEVLIVPVWGALSDLSKVPDVLCLRMLTVPYPLTVHTLLINCLCGMLSPIRYVAFVFRARRTIGLAHTFSAVVLAWLLRKLQVDRIHAHFASSAALWGLLVADWLGIPYSCTGHGSDVLINRAPYLPDLLKRARPFITISEYNRQRLMTEVEAARRADIQVIRCGVDLERFRPEGANRPDVAVPTILSVTWLRAIKGPDYLVEACAVLKERGYAFRCVIVGGGELWDQIRQQVVERQITAQVTLTGPLPRSEVIEWYRTADIFVLPSLSEGIPVALMEAMAMCLPVVATRITGIPELVDDEINGLLVEPRDVAALADRIAHLMSDPPLRRRLGLAAREKVAREFNLELVTDRLERVFLEYR